MNRNKHRTHSDSKNRSERSNPPGTIFVMGRNSVREALRHSPDSVLKVYCATTLGDQEISDRAAELGIEIEAITEESLTALVNSTSHQAYAAQIKEQPALELKQFIADKQETLRSLVIMLDTINDPQNLGAILRAAECFGADAVVWSKNRGVGVTPVVTKASVGASLLVPTIPVSNLGEALRKLKDAGYWIVAADAAAGSQAMPEFEFPEKCVIVFGSEGEGIQRLLLDNSDYKVAIPLLGKIDSLNVSQAVAVFLFRYRQLHSTK